MRILSKKGALALRTSERAFGRIYSQQNEGKEIFTRAFVAT
jgi:hypothetical protein